MGSKRQKKKSNLNLLARGDTFSVRPRPEQGFREMKKMRSNGKRSRGFHLQSDYFQTPPNCGNLYFSDIYICLLECRHNLPFISMQSFLSSLIFCRECFKSKSVNRSLRRYLISGTPRESCLFRMFCRRSSCFV
jgi:hypothetical protein